MGGPQNNYLCFTENCHFSNAAATSQSNQKPSVESMVESHETSAAAVVASFRDKSSNEQLASLTAAASDEHSQDQQPPATAANDPATGMSKHP